MFKTFFLSELSYRFRQPMVYIFLLIITVLVCLSATLGDTPDNIIRDSPYFITRSVTTFTMIGLLMAAAFFNSAALKDYSNGFNEILFSTPLSKRGFYFGRFFGALIACTFPYLGVFLGFYLGSVIGPLTGNSIPEQYGGLSFATIYIDYLMFILPNMFIAGAFIFAIAVKWKSAVISFVGAMVILITYMVSGSLLSDIDNETIGALLDTFGIRTYSNYTKYYSVLEKNTLYPVFEGVMLINRLFWIGIGVVVLGVSYFSFSFQSKNKKVGKLKKATTKIDNTVFGKPVLTQNNANNVSWKQFVSFFMINFRSITKSITFKILLIFGVLLFITRLFSGFEYFGLKSYPVTYKMISAIEGSSFIFIIIILVFFSGELIWRDRESKINEVIDATPHSSFVSLFAKAMSLISIVSLFHFLFVLMAIIYQILSGYGNIELDVYLINYLVVLLPLFITWSGTLILIQVIVQNKYLAYFVSILLVFVSGAILAALDVETNMLYLAGGPSLVYSDMNGFGPALKGAIWFALYWGLFSLFCLFIAGMLWSRGLSVSLKNKVLKAKKSVPKGYLAVTTIVFTLWIAVGGFVYYNTQVLNTYKTGDELEVMRAEYEKKFKKYEDATLPKITEIKYFIDIFPKERGLDVRAVLSLTNESHKVLDSIHFNLNDDWITEFNIPNSEIVLNDEEFGYIIYKLNKGLQPHENIEIEIKNKYITKGFKNNRENTKIIRNGTFVDNMSILPEFGYSSGFELSDRNTRKKYGLPSKKRMPELESQCSGACMSNYLSGGLSDFIDVETVISTSSDQMAIAPGSLVKEWQENDRNYYHYKVDHVSQNFYSFISAKYEVAKRDWNGISIEVYHDKKHGVNVEMMLDAVERSLKYFTANFGPYYHKQCRIIEFPRYATFAQAFPGTMPYSEGFGFVADLESETGNNVVDAVVSHEMAHQWWAHQVVGANMQGGTLMSESFAEYSSLMTMKNMTDNPMKIRKFLKYDHDRYLRGRGGETQKERPLYKVENQQYIHYGKGSVILFALQDYIGEANVNTAMSNFLNEFKYKAPPYPTSLDFLKHLEPEVPDSLSYLITDWFKEITLYDNRVKETSYKTVDNGKYEVTISVASEKIKIDSLGVETKVGMNDWIDLGVFADNEEDSLIFQKRVKIDKPNMTFTFVIDGKPVRAAIDPRMLLIDRVYNDNSKGCNLIE